MIETNPYYKIVVYVPEDYLDQVKTALFTAGAGNIGQYSHCSFETKGKGQFKPLAQAQQFLGERGQIKVVDEVKLEVLCPSALIKKSLDALKKSHPYEEPAIDIIPLYNHLFI